MRILSKLVVGAAVAATAVAMAAPSALADPPRGVHPKAFDVVGTGSNTIEFVWDQFSVDYNNTHRTPHNVNHPFIYSWDALTSGSFVPKVGCKPVLRANANGSSAGIALLAAAARTPSGNFCEDFARSSRARKSTDPAFKKGGVAFVKFARDAITYASRVTRGGTNAPKNLSTAQLHNIYSCTVRHWNQVGGSSPATIVPVLPQSSSGTRSSFLSDISVTTPGSCVVSTATLEENQGTTKLFNSPNVITPFSIGKWLAQKFRSPVCGHAPKRGQNSFGCNVDGFLGLNSINHTAPTLGKGASQVINPRFSAPFFRFLYDVVRFATNTPTHIPAYLERFFNPASARVKGWLCTNINAKAAIVDYGFLNTPLCGQAN
jgi:ABC-type phosphate transport system substrate-binding protein